MADIIINPGSSLMSFTSSLNYTQTITQDVSGSLILQGSGSTGRTDLFTVNGNNGTLFSVSDDLSDSLFSVNTIAGLPVIEAFANNTVTLGQYGQNVLVVTGSRVGIGTSAPAYKLDITAASTSDGLRISQGGAARFVILGDGVAYWGPTANLGVLTWDTGKAIIMGQSGAALSLGSNGTWDRVFLDTSGNLGIGTNNPGAKLDVAGDIFLSETGRLQGRGYPYDTTVGSGADASTAIIEAGSTNGYRSRIALAGGNATDSNTIKFTTTSAERMRIDSSGNVGIGTSSNLSALTIYKGSGTNAYIEVAGNGNTPGSTSMVYGQDGSSNGYVWNRANATVYFGTNNSSKMVILAGGNVGIGNTSPNQKLEISVGNGNTGGLRINYASTATSEGMDITYLNTGATVTSFDSRYDSNNAVMQFRMKTTGTPVTAMTILGSGKVGIGTTNPGYDLEVNGWVGASRYYPYSSNSTYINGDGSGLLIAGTGYLYVPASGGSYFEGSVRMRGSISNDNGAYLQINGGTSGYTYFDGTVGIGVTNPSSKLHIVGSGASNVPVFKIVGSGSDTFNWASSSVFANLTGNENVIHLFGKAESGYNSAYVGYRHVSDGSSSNMLTFGLYGSDNLVNILGNGYVGIGTTAPSYALQVQGTAYINSTLYVNGATTIEDTFTVKTQDGSYTVAAIDYSGAAGGRIKVYTDGVLRTQIGSYSGDETFFNVGYGGNVGIGTSSPSARLDIRSLASAGATNAPTFRAFGYDTDSYFQVNSNSNNSADITLTRSDSATMFSVDGHTGTTYFAGNVGIGLGNPDYKLHVYDTATSNARILIQGASNYALLQTTNSGGTIYIGIDNSSGTGFGTGAYSRVFYSSDNYPLVISTNGTERMRITGGGNVGIGTTSPTSKFSVNGLTTLSNATSRVGSITIGAVNSTGYSPYMGGAETSAAQSNTVIGDGAFVNNTTGSYNVMLGAMAGAAVGPVGSPTVTSLNQGVYLGTFALPSANNNTNEIVIGFYATGNGSNSVTIGNTNITKTILQGNVGIGTTNPGYKLDVSGSANIKGSITGQDSSGNYRYEFSPGLAYTRVGVGDTGDHKVNSGAASITSMLRLKSSSTYGWLEGSQRYFNGTVISDGLCADTIPTPGTLVFLTSDSEWGIADADVVAKSTSLLGIALNDTSNIGDTVHVMIDGIISLYSNHDQITSPATPGAPLYVSTTAGCVTEVAPSGTGDVVRLVGHNLSSVSSGNDIAVIRFQPDATWIEL